MSYTAIDDPDVDIITTNRDIKIFIDLRGKGLEVDKLLLRADNLHIYIYDPISNTIIKIVNLPDAIEPLTLTVNQRNDTIALTVKKISY
uniref:ArsA HSP20-like domain-containing protein n=1 Tax=Acidianus sulfidivorans JP7 TaxID=619593 RepID=A0A2U9IN60_9CREN